MYGFNWRGEFINKVREEKYFQDEVGPALKQIKIILLIAGFLYLSFSGADYFLVKNPVAFRLILSLRLLFLALLAYLSVKLPKLAEKNTYYRWITAYEYLFVFSFCVIYILYESPILLIQSWNVILMILGFHLIPNRWTHMLEVSLFLYVCFILITLVIYPYLPFIHFLISVFYLLIVLVFSSITAWRINRFKRCRYLDMKRIKLFSTHDMLTHVYNRFKFEQELQNGINLAKRYQTPFSLIFYDLDDFKNINDRFGHLTGDKVLRTQAQLAKSNIRVCDVFARWGGEEFCLLLPNTGIEGALDTARKMKRLISEIPFDFGHITCSFGVTSYRDEDDKTSIILRADRMQYAAKQAGKDRIVSDLDDKI